MEAATSSLEREQRFRHIHDSAYLDLLRFVRRRVHPTHAEDIVGDVMLVAWRRLDDVPTELSDARAWLFGVARKTPQNARRREDRHEAIAVRLTPRSVTFPWTPARIPTWLPAESMSLRPGHC